MPGRVSRMCVSVCACAYLPVLYVAQKKTLSYICIYFHPLHQSLEHRPSSELFPTQSVCAQVNRTSCHFIRLCIMMYLTGPY